MYTIQYALCSMHLLVINNNSIIIGSLREACRRWFKVKISKYYGNKKQFIFEELREGSTTFPEFIIQQFSSF